jgi:hypothetical protein
MSSAWVLLVSEDADGFASADTKLGEVRACVNRDSHLITIDTLFQGPWMACWMRRGLSRHRRHPPLSRGLDQ